MKKTKYAIYAGSKVVATAYTESNARIKAEDVRTRGHKAVRCYERATGLLTAY